MGDDKAKRFFKSLSKPTVGWFYLICAGLCIVLFVTKHVLNTPIYGHDAILLLITIYLAITECYVNFTEEEEHKKTETFTSSSITGTLVLVTSSSCPYCTNYINSRTWSVINKLIGKSGSVAVLNYDLYRDYNKIYGLGMNPNSITQVPTIFFNTPKKGAVPYNDDIYNSDRVVTAFQKVLRY